jgi:hypothetical protein
MLDEDLAELYQVTIGNLNRVVVRDIKRGYCFGHFFRIIQIYNRVNPQPVQVVRTGPAETYR